MPRASVCVLASLISGVSTALILASNPSYAGPRSLRGTVHDVKRGQSMQNGCRAGPCQIAYLNSVEDFCLWAPPSPPAFSVTTNAEHTLVAWCMNSAHRNRLIPDGTITGAHMMITPQHVQIMGVGKLTNINVPADGVASASGQGHNVRGVVFTSAYGQLEQIYDWTSFVSQERFCFRACRPSAAASGACSQIHDISECSENFPGDYDAGMFEECNATEMPSTLYQEALLPPSHHSTQPFSSCTIRSTKGGAVAHPRRAIVPLLLTSFSPQSHSHSTQVASTTTGTAITITSPRYLITTPTATGTSVNSTTPVSPAVPTSAPHSYSHTHSRSSFASSSSSSHHSFSPFPSSSSVASSLYGPSMSLPSSPPTSSMPSIALTSPMSPSDPSSGTPTSSVTSTTMLALPPTPSFSSSQGISSSIPGPSSSPSTSYNPSTPSPAATPTLSSTSSSTSPSMSSSMLSSTPLQSSYAGSSTPTSLSSSSSPTTPPASSPPSFTSPVMSPSTSSPASSQSSSVLTFTTPSSSITVTSSASSSPVVPSSQTQIGSQCPPLVAANGGSVVPLTPLFHLALTFLMIILSSSVGILVL